MSKQERPSAKPAEEQRHIGKPVGYFELVLQNANFRWLWGGQIVSLLGDWFNLIASAKEHSILILYVSDQMKLGEWVGLCKIDKTGTARKVVKCSCAVIKDIGEETEAWSTVLEYVKTKAASA